MADDKVALVTGGNRGLGLATSTKLARRGYQLVITARKSAEGEAAVAKILAAVPGANVRSLPLDLASFASIRAFADAFHALKLPLHLLVANAGLMNTNPKPEKTADGFELTLGTNHIGHFLLIHLLMGDLERSAPSRIVVLSSSMHRAGVAPGPGPDFDYDNLNAEKSFHPTIAYRNSKLAAVWFTRELARRRKGNDKDVAVLAVSPGWVPETLADARPSAFQRFLFRHVLPHLPISRTLEQGSDNTVFAATEPDLQSQSGGYYEDLKPGIVSDDGRDEAKARRLWDASCGWCGIGTFGQR
jgi:NAD(P)-dependent dehydrogenase (short-subunit alcohol dehydrogenase family)